MATSARKDRAVNSAKGQKTEKFDIRLSPQEDAVIKQAAELTATTPTNFIRQQAVVAAKAVLEEKSRLIVTNEQWAKIEALLTSPAKVLPKLEKKLAASDDWDDYR